MPFVIPDGAMQVTLNWSGSVFDRGRAASVFGITGSTDDLQAPAENVVAIWEENVLGAVNEAVTLDTVTVVTSDRVAIASSGTVGGRSGNMSPPNVCPLLKLTTGFRGPSMRGRMYHPGLLNDDDVADDGSITGTKLADLQSTFANVISALSTDHWSWVILHRDGSTPTPINGGLVEGRIATQRRRLR